MRRFTLLLLAVSAVVRAQDFNLDLTHALENETIYESSDARNTLDENAWVYKPRLRFDKGRLRAEAELDFRYDGYYHIGEEDFTEGERDQQETQTTIRNLWVSYQADSWDLTVGKQILRWGYTTGVRPVIDVINAQDRRSPFAQIVDNPIGENMVRLEYFGSRGPRVSSFLLFDRQTDEVPVYSSRYNGVPLNWEDNAHTRAEGGLRLEWELENNARIALMAADLVDNAAVYTSTADPSLLRADYDRYRIAGLSYLTEVFQGTFKTDLAYSFGKAFTAVDGPVAAPRQSDYVHGRIYYDNITIPNLTLSGGYSYARILDHQPTMLEPEVSQLWYFSAAREVIDYNSIASLNLQKSVGQGANLGNDATTATAGWTYIGIDNLQLSLMWRQVFRSGDDLPFENGLVFVGKYFF